MPHHGEAAPAVGLGIEGQTFVVAASDSVDPARADYQCNGVDDQAEINLAILALPATGGVVCLLEGTFSITGTINMRSYVSLVGSGRGTVLTIPDGHNVALAVITCSAVTRIRIAELFIDGNRANQAAGVMVGISPNALTYSIIESIWIENMREQGIYHVANCDYNLISNSMIIGNGAEGVDFTAACDYNSVEGCQILNNGASGITLNNVINYNTITGNTIRGNTHSGILIGGACLKNVIVGNNIVSNGRHGIQIGVGSHQNLISGNFIENNNQRGIDVEGANYTTIIGNSIWTAGFSGIELDTCISTMVSGNLVAQCARHGIYVVDSDYGVIMGNVLLENDYANTATYDGISLSGSAGNLILGNRCRANDRWGIMVDVDSDFNKVSNNYTEGNTSGSIRINNANCDGNEIVWNTVEEGAPGDVGTLTRASGNFDPSANAYIAVIGAVPF